MRESLQVLYTVSVKPLPGYQCLYLMEVSLLDQTKIIWLADPLLKKSCGGLGFNQLPLRMARTKTRPIHYMCCYKTVDFAAMLLLTGAE
jgi:hypothetical protein